jgi:hypothetical protein
MQLMQLSVASECYVNKAFLILRPENAMRSESDSLNFYDLSAIPHHPLSYAIEKALQGHGNEQMCVVEEANVADVE